MKRIVSWALGASLASFAFLAVPSAHADSYAVYSLTGDNGYNLIGINAAGDVVVESPFGCSTGDPNRCYEIFSNGSLISKSDSLTGFTLDNGSACSFTSPGNLLVGRSVCNGDWQVAGIRNDSGAPAVLDLFSNSSYLDLFGSADVLFVNSSGEFAMVNGLNDEIEEVIPTPEPATFILFLSIGLCGFLVLRHRATIR